MHLIPAMPYGRVLLPFRRNHNNCGDWAVYCKPLFRMIQVHQSYNTSLGCPRCPRRWEVCFHRRVRSLHGSVPASDRWRVVSEQRNPQLKMYSRVIYAGAAAELEATLSDSRFLHSMYKHQTGSDGLENHRTVQGRTAQEGTDCAGFKGAGQVSAPGWNEWTVWFVLITSWLPSASALESMSDMCSLVYC